MKIQNTNIGNNTQFSGVVITPQVQKALSRVQMDVLQKATMTLERIANRDHVDVKILGDIYVDSADEMGNIIARTIKLEVTKKQSFIKNLFKRPKTADTSMSLDLEAMNASSKHIRFWVVALNNAIGKLK